jgi:hypothetical protein
MIGEAAIGIEREEDRRSKAADRVRDERARIARLSPLERDRIPRRKAAARERHVPERVELELRTVGPRDAGDLGGAHRAEVRPAPRRERTAPTFAVREDE